MQDKQQVSAGHSANADELSSSQEALWLASGWIHLPPCCWKSSKMSEKSGDVPQVRYLTIITWWNQCFWSRYVLWKLFRVQSYGAPLPPCVDNKTIIRRLSATYLLLFVKGGWLSRSSGWASEDGGDGHYLLFWVWQHAQAVWSVSSCWYLLEPREKVRKFI